MVAAFTRSYGNVPADEAVVEAEQAGQADEANLSKLEAKLDGYEAILSKQKYLAGDVSFSTSFADVKNCSVDTKKH